MANVEPFADPTRTQPFRMLEVAAEQIDDQPQTNRAVIAALRELCGKVERWRLLYLWEYLRFDAAAEPHRLIGAQQNLNAALNGIARELKIERLGPMALTATDDTR